MSKPLKAPRSVRRAHEKSREHVHGYYSWQFDRTWKQAVNGIRLSFDIRQLPQDIKDVLDEYRPKFEMLRRREEALFGNMNRADGAKLCASLYKRHDEYERAMLLDIGLVTDADEHGYALLCYDVEERIIRMHAMRQALRLMICQGHFIEDDLRRKILLGDANILEVSRLAAIDYYRDTQASLPFRGKVPVPG